MAEGKIDPRDWEAVHEAARGSLAVFTQLAWPELNRGTPLVWGWHNDAICEHLQAVTNGEITQLIINISPGMSKTTHVCQTWPVWEWLHAPHRRWGFAAYGGTLTLRDSRKRRNLMTSEWYIKSFAPKWQLKGDANTVVTVENTETGEMTATSIGGAVTGFHYDRLIVDDPLKADEIYTVALKNHVEWFNSAWSSRRRDKKKSAMVIIMQRLHDKDLAGVKIAEGGWVHLDLPMEYVPKRHCTTSIGWSDPRTVAGELMCPARFDEVEAAKEKRVPRIWASQYQQSPRVGDGTVFREAWIQYYHLDEHIPGCVPFPGAENMDRVLTSWDLTFDGGAKNDFNAGGVWGRKGTDAYLIDRVCAQMRFTEQQWAFRRMAKKWPEATRHLIEKKANGAAVIDVLSRPAFDVDGKMQWPGVPGILGVTPRAPKVVRAELAAGFFQTGNVYLPHPSIAPWVNDYVSQLCSFPTGDNDDEVDQTSQALMDLMRGSSVTSDDYDAILPSDQGSLYPGHVDTSITDPREAQRALDIAAEEAREEERWKQRERERIAARLGLNIDPGSVFTTRR